MSTTYSFVCDECKKRIWAGQSKHIYKYREVAEFLHNHIGHKLRFVSNHVEDKLAESYEEIKY